MRCGLSARSSVSERSGTPCNSDKVSSKCPEVSATTRYAPCQFCATDSRFAQLPIERTGFGVEVGEEGKG